MVVIYIRCRYGRFYWWEMRPVSLTADWSGVTGTVSYTKKSSAKRAGLRFADRHNFKVKEVVAEKRA